MVPGAGRSSSSNDSLGYVSLENFTRALVLKTTDGGETWRKIDVAGNANLEGIGFLDETNGWVGGWGDENFTTGTSSFTGDGGQSWTNANEIGRFINRFRFFGTPARFGYASGRSVYRFSSQPVPAVAAIAPARSLIKSSDDAVYRDPAVPIQYRRSAWRQAGFHSYLEPVRKEDPCPLEREHPDAWRAHGDLG